MGGNSRQKKSTSSSSSSSFSVFGLFKGRISSKARSEDYEYVNRAYKVYPSDEDRDRWVADPGIDKKASAYISYITNRWEKVDVAN